MGNRFLYILLSCLFLLSCRNQSTKDNYNISKVNIRFLNILDSFEINTTKYSNKKNALISISVIIDKKDTIIGLHSNLKLKKEYFIGEYEFKNIPVYFYSNYKYSINNFYNVDEKSIPIHDSHIHDPMEIIDTYTEYYYFKNGLFIP